MHGKIHVTFSSTYLLNNESYNMCFLTICFYSLWLISKVKDELQDVIENSANFIKIHLRFAIFVKVLYDEAFPVQIQQGSKIHIMISSFRHHKEGMPGLFYNMIIKEVLQKVKNGQRKSREKYARNKSFITFFKKRQLFGCNNCI